MKSITALIVLSLVIASLLVVGCTNSTTNQTPSASTATHDAFLENYLAGVKNSFSDNNLTAKAWEVTWINSTSAHVEYTIFNKSTNGTGNHVVTYTVFPTTQDATNYLNAMNKTAYSLVSTDNSSTIIYQKITGHAPQIYKYYVWNEGNQNHGIMQFDNLIKIETAKSLII
jgi:hypothetical protein